MSDLIIKFPTKEHREDFMAWLSDGGGEYMYMEGPFDDIEPIVEFDYSAAFPAWGFDGESPPVIKCLAGPPEKINE